MTPFEKADYERLKHKIVALELDLAKEKISVKNLTAKIQSYKHQEKLKREKSTKKKIKPIGERHVTSA